MKRTTTGFAALAAAVLIGSAAAPASADETSERDGAEVAVEVLERLPVAEDSEDADFDREGDYAPDGWTDADGTGCDTREDLLSRDLEAETLTHGDGDCVIEYGQMSGPYSGEAIEHVQGESDIDVEHVIAVEQFNRSGGHEFDVEVQQAFYQDKENLMLAGAAENQAKGSDDITDYLPPNDEIHCDYAGSMIYAYDKWGLSITASEHGEFEGILATEDCEGALAAPAQQMVTDNWEFDESFDDHAEVARGEADHEELDDQQVEELSSEGAEDTDEDGEAAGPVEEVHPAVLIVGAILVALIGGGAIFSGNRSRPGRR